MLKLPTSLTFLLSLPLLAAEETAITPHIDTVELFKNGVAVVQASFEITAPGTYRWDEVPTAVHGSFWVESKGTVDVRTGTRSIEWNAPSEEPSGKLQDDLAGKQVTIDLKMPGEKLRTLQGRVWTLPSPPQTPHHSSLANPAQSRNSWMPNHANPPASFSTGSFLVLETENGQREYIAQHNIVSLSVNGPFEAPTQTVQRPVMLFEVRDAPATSTRVHISYLSRGLTWAPSYLLDLTDPDELSIRQSAVVKNELVALNNAELKLISGFPNIRFSQVDSPLSVGTSLSTFFQQLAMRNGTPQGALDNQMVTYNIAPSANLPALPDIAEAGTPGDDLHYESIGKRTLELGDSLALDLASAKASYKRVVEWKVPDSRDYRGRYHNNNGQPNDENHAWDAIMFHNPFKFPMTTGPAMITENDHFRGQSLSEWVNPGQSTCLRITKALSIRTDYSEIEEEGERKIVWVSGNDYQLTKVKGTLHLRNFRGTEVTINATGQFSGELIEADGDPSASLRTNGITSINPRRELNWMVQLAPGEEKTINFRYSVLVWR